MNMTDPGALLPLTAVYVTTTSAVLLCEVTREVTTEPLYWEIWLTKEGEDYDEVYALGYNSDTNVEPPHLYHRLLQLDRDTTYTAKVVAVDNVNQKSPESNEVTFTTFPPF